jgi:hypothetical protein
MFFLKQWRWIIGYDGKVNGVQYPSYSSSQVQFRIGLSRRTKRPSVRIHVRNGCLERFQPGMFCKFMLFFIIWNESTRNKD